MAFNLKETYRDNCPPDNCPPPPTIAPLRTTPPGLFPAADYCPLPQDNSPPPQDNPPPTIASNDNFLSSGSSNGRGGGRKIVRVRGIVLGGNGSGELSSGGNCLGGNCPTNEGKMVCIQP